MSIDERVRTGLVRNTEHLLPDVELELAATYGRARTRRYVRRGALALATAAAVAVTVWVVDVPGLDDDVAPVTPDPTPEAPADLVGVRGSLDPGTYSLAAWGETNAADPLPRAIVEVPAGYFSNGGWVIDAGHDAIEPDDFGAVQVWRVDRVLADPCDRSTATEVGPTVTDLARALVRQSGPSTQPSPTSLDGHRGLTMTVTVPPAAELTPCAGGYYPLWMAERDGYQSHSDPEVVHHLWILDVDGTRLVLVASLYPDQDPAQQEELIAIAESVHFVEPGS